MNNPNARVYMMDILSFEGKEEQVDAMSALGKVFGESYHHPLPSAYSRRRHEKSKFHNRCNYTRYLRFLQGVIVCVYVRDIRRRGR